jgi:tryptophan synthase alpha chain
MTRIGRKFEELGGRERALVCFFTAGDPSLTATEQLVLQAVESGADIVELGVPFSDPIADGPSIQAASLRALAAGTTLAGVLELVHRLREKTPTPLILMTYYNPVLRYGVERFAGEGKPAHLLRQSQRPARRHRLDTIFLLAPTSTDARIQRVAERASGFIYCVSRTGVTGTRAALPNDLQQLVTRIRGMASQPVAVGFGISTPEHVRQVTRFADAAVVGSALVDVVARTRGPSPEVAHLVRALKAATR